jgi:hypothetical protein
VVEDYNHSTYRYLHISVLINVLSTRHRNSAVSETKDVQNILHKLQLTRSFHEPHSPGNGWGVGEAVIQQVLLLLYHHPAFGQFGIRSHRALHIAALPSCVIHAPAVPAATNFCNSTIDINLRNAGKSVEHLPNLHRHLYSAQLAALIHKQKRFTADV